MKPRECQSCGDTIFAVGRAETIDGRTIYPHWCVACGDVYTSAQATKAEVAEWIRQHGEPQRVYTSTERRIQRGEKVTRNPKHGRPCEVCKATENVEVHHWAPAHLFGPESEKCPMGFLCRPCHTKWHRLVTPNMGERKGAYREHYDAERDRRNKQPPC